MIIQRRKFQTSTWINLILLLTLLVTVVTIRYKPQQMILEAKKLVIKWAGLSGKSNQSETIADLLRIPGGFFRGTYPAPVQHLALHIRQKHFKRITAEKEMALQRGILRFQNTYPMAFTFEGRTEKGKIRLKGDLSDHWKGNDRWSFRLRLKKDEFICGFREFSIQKPLCRQYPYDYIFHQWMKRIGNISPCYDFLRVSVNGDDWGIMLAEEQLTPTFLEKRQKKTSLVFRLEDQSRWYYQWFNENQGRTPDPYIKFVYDQPAIDFYSEKKINQSAVQQNQAGYCQQQLTALLQGRIPPSTFLDVTSFSRAFLAALAWHDYHSLAKTNARYYLNPYTLQVEIITTDAAIAKDWDPSSDRSLLNPEKLKLQVFPLYCRLLTDPEFHSACRRRLPELLNAWTHVPADLARLQQVFPLEDLQFPALSERILENIKILQQELENILPTLAAHCENELAHPPAFPCSGIPPGAEVAIPRQSRTLLHTSGTMEVFNLMSAPLQVESLEQISRDGSRSSISLTPFNVNAGWAGTHPESAQISIPPATPNDGSEWVVTTSCGGTRMTESVRVIHGTNLFNPLRNSSPISSELPLEGNWSTSERADELRLGPGLVSLHQPLILAPGIRLVILPATDVKVADHAYIIVQGPLIAEGRDDARIRFQGIHQSWKGIYVCAAAETSRLKSVDIRDTESLADGVLTLTGAITFYRSPVEISDCHFTSTRAEDQLNLVYSRFQISDSRFSLTGSDAIDSDFSSGTLTRCQFSQIQGDALDTSGSTVTVDGLTADHIQDKVISGGECSQLVIRQLNARTVGAGLVAKDGSTVQASEVTIEEAQVKAVMIYTKKPFYEQAARLTISASPGLTPADVTLQAGNHCQLNGRQIQSQIVDVDALYASGPMKKSR